MSRFGAWVIAGLLLAGPATAQGVGSTRQTGLVPGPANEVTAEVAPPAQPVPLALTGDDQQRLADCRGRDVTVTGNRSAYVLRGGCKSVTLRGDLLAVQADILPGARIAITGRGSIVSWVVNGRGPGPLSVVRGGGSRSQRAEAIGGVPVR